MNFKEFDDNRDSLENKDLDSMASRLSPDNVRLLHGMMGLSTETGEIMNVLKRHVIYGAPLDKTNLKEELGDVLFYMSLLMDCLGTSLDEVMALNVAKLKTRYGSKFTESAALNRNLELEQEILENGQKKTAQ